MRSHAIVATFSIAAFALTDSLRAAETSKREEEKFVRPSDVALDTPRPEYPYKARANGHEGAGIFRLAVHPNGAVLNVTTKKSTGFAELDESATTALSRWRFKPRAAKYVEVPVNFVMMRPGNWRDYRYGHAAGYDVVRWKVIPATTKPSPSPR